VLEQVEAEVLRTAQAVGAVATGRRRRADDAVAESEITDAGTDRFDHPGPLMTERPGDPQASVPALDGLEIGATGQGDRDTRQNLAISGLGDVDRF
jgi:hypothetical protein